MITFEEIMRNGGVFYLLKYDGSEIKTFPYSMVWYTKDSEVINIEGERVKLLISKAKVFLIIDTLA